MQRRTFNLIVAHLASVYLGCLFSGQIALGESVFAPPSDSLREVNEFLQNHCIDCHSSDLQSGDLNLQGLEVSSQAISRRDWNSSTWEKIVRRLQARQMPPADALRPTESDYEASISQLTGVLDAHASRFPKPGRTSTLRRLTRTEYANAIRDLLALDVRVEELLPPEESSHGFDNVTVGELSPVLLGRYLAAAEKISRLAVGHEGRTPGGATFRVPADQTQEGHIEGLPLGTRGGAVVQYNFPQTGEYEVVVRLARDRDGKIEGLSEPHQIDILVDRDRRHRMTIKPPGGPQADAHLHTKLSVSAGPHSVGVTFPRKSSALIETRRQPFDARFNLHRHPRLSPAIYEISIAGPFSPREADETPSRQRIFSCRPEDPNDLKQGRECAEAILSRLMRHAYRRPIGPADLATPMAFYEQTASEKGFEEGVEAAVAAVLVNPNFLFRIETDPDEVETGDAYLIDDFELASRLSFFLWSSVPDDELLDLAAAGRLQDEEVLRSQTLRMLADPRSQALTDNFAAQWLYLRNLESITPDLRLFPDFDDNLRQAFLRETQLLFEDVLQNNRSVLRLIDIDFTFLNERLATHYGISDVKGSHFRRVDLDPASHRGGILRHGSVLTVTSYATRTAPTIRGNWVLKNLLGTPPPPPPPNVPSLKEKTETAALSVRERLAEHRENPACASCHDLMDPIGFALENFDAVGRWRTVEDGLPIDPSGTMPDGSKIANVADLEASILNRPDMFVGTVAEKLLTYALGRGLEPSDAPAIRTLLRNVGQQDHRLSAVIVEIVQSHPFRMRTAQ